MAKNHLLIQLGTEILSSLEQTLVDANALRDNLRSSLDDYDRHAEPSPQSEARLRADLLLAQSFTPGLKDAWQDAGPAVAADLAVLPMDRAIRFRIEGRWRAHEFSGVLAATNTIYQLFAVRYAALPRLLRHSGRALTRSNVYDEARLYYYLESREELQVGRLRYSSPGEIELLSQLAVQIPEVLRATWWVLLLVTIAPRAIREIPSIRRHWVEENVRTDLLKQQREKSRLLHDLIVKHVRQALEHTSQTASETAEKGLHELEEAIRAVTETDAVDPLRLVEKQIQALATISRQVEEK